MNFLSIIIFVFCLSSPLLAAEEDPYSDEIASLNEFIKKSYMKNYQLVVEKKYHHVHPAPFVKAMKRLEQLYYAKANYSKKKFHDTPETKKYFKRYRWFEDVNSHLIVAIEKPRLGFYLSSHVHAYDERVSFVEDYDRKTSKNLVIGGLIGLGHQHLRGKFLYNFSLAGLIAQTSTATATRDTQLADKRLAILGLVFSPSMGVQVNRKLNLYFGVPLSYRKLSTETDESLEMKLQNTIIYGVELSALYKLGDSLHLSGAIGVGTQNLQSRLGITYFL